MHLVSSCSQLLHHVQKKTFSCQTAAASSFYIVRHLLRRFQCLLNFFIHYFSFRRAPQGIGPNLEEASSLDISRYTDTVTQGAAFAGHLSLRKGQRTQRPLHASAAHFSKRRRRALFSGPLRFEESRHPPALSLLSLPPAPPLRVSVSRPLSAAVAAPTTPIHTRRGIFQKPLFRDASEQWRSTY